MKTVLYPVRDVAAAKQVYDVLLGAPQVDEPYYVHYVAPDGQAIGLVPGGHDQGMTGPVGHWHVDDIEQAIKDLVAAGATETSPAKNVGGGRLVATVTDADGNPIGLLQDPQG